MDKAENQRARTMSIPAILVKQAGFWKALKTTGKIAVPTALLGGTLLYYNNKTKKDQPDYTGEQYKFTKQAPVFGGRR